MHTDAVINNEFQSCQPYPINRQSRGLKGDFRIRQIQHNAGFRLFQLTDINFIFTECQLARIDKPRIPFGTGHGNRHIIFHLVGGISTTDNRRYTQFTGNNRCVTGAPAAVGHNSRSHFHHRLPVWIGDIGNQYFTRFQPVHFCGIGNHTGLACSDAFAHTLACHQRCRFVCGFQPVLQLVLFVFLRGHGFRTCLQNIQVTAFTVFCPLYIHGSAIVLFNRHRIACQLQHVLVINTESLLIIHRHRHIASRQAGRGILTVHHAPCLATQLATNNRCLAIFQRGLEYIKLIRVNRPLHHILSQPPGAVYQHNILKAGFGINGEHHTGGACIGAHHFLYANRQCHFHVLKAFMHAIGNGAIGKQGCIHPLAGEQ